MPEISFLKCQNMLVSPNWQTELYEPLWPPKLLETEFYAFSFIHSVLKQARAHPEKCVAQMITTYFTQSLILYRWTI